ncbi:MAG TPA: gliding motility-associated C-terminal domain-containing protein [Bacteroidia bacterium]|nr:gliding motility-associated C-terminal domain-containing protein [Bacteroidia bacterium]
MKKNVFPIHILNTNKITLLFLLSFFAFSVQITKGQCCATTSFTKPCKGKQTGTATITPCTPGNYTYLWDDANSQTTPVATDLAAGIYHVIISGVNFSCNPYTVIVTDSSCTPYSVPNILTPNGDGVNDRFVITGLESGTKLTIYNYWGSVVYASNDYMNDWEAPNLGDGVYFYVLNRPNADAHPVSKNDPSRGFIQILTGR